jgi:hypothetical protein
MLYGGATPPFLNCYRRPAERACMAEEGCAGFAIPQCAYKHKLTCCLLRNPVSE